MPPSARLLALGTAAALLAGCTGEESGARRPGDPVTREEAGTLASLLQRNAQAGGADFVASAPYGADAVLTLTGEVDFRTARGRARAVLRTDAGAEEQQTVFFTDREIWFGEVPGLAEALVADGAPDADYLRRPLSVAEGGSPALVDVLAHLVLRLAAPGADDPAAFLGGWTWRGDEQVGELAAVGYAAGDHAVAVGGAEDLLLRLRTPVPGTGVEATVTLSEHGRQEIGLPGDAETADAEDHPAVVEALLL